MTMSRIFEICNIRVFRVGLPVLLFAIIISLASCRKPEKVAAVNEPQKTFASPQEAGNALLEAAKSGNQAALIEIFGPNSREILFIEDSGKDAKGLKDFAAAYETMNRWGKINAGG